MKPNEGTLNRFGYITFKLDLLHAAVGMLSGLCSMPILMASDIHRLTGGRVDVIMWANLRTNLDDSGLCFVLKGARIGLDEVFQKGCLPESGRMSS